MALSCNPEILIADEPTTALDVTVQKTIIELLLKPLKAERNMSLIFISHDLVVISEIADRVLVMYKGEVVEEAPVKTLFAHPKHPYTKGLLGLPPIAGISSKKTTCYRRFSDADKKGVSIGKIREGYAYPVEEIEARKRKLYSQQPLLKIKGLNKWFPVNSGFFNMSKDVVKAANEVSFDVYPGETLGLVGESGCGKTTLGRSIYGFDRANNWQHKFREY